MTDPLAPPTFRLAITSLEDFLIFCAFIRGKELDEDKLNSLVARLRQANDREQQTTAANTPTT